MPKVKITINVDEETWDNFKRAFSSSRGSLRSLSEAVEEAIRSFDTVGILACFMAAMGMEGGLPSLRDVKGGRPRPGTSAGEAVRAMRDERAGRILGH
jgi:hypothetical protein